METQLIIGPPARLHWWQRLLAMLIFTDRRLNAVIIEHGNQHTCWIWCRRPPGQPPAPQDYLEQLYNAPPANK